MPTQIIIVGEFSKEQLAQLVRELWKIQKQNNPREKLEKMFVVSISNNVYSDAEVREIITENFRDIKDVEVVDVVEKMGTDIQKSLKKKQAM